MKINDPRGAAPLMNPVVVEEKWNFLSMVVNEVLTNPAVIIP